MSDQLILFEASQEKNKDGSFTVRPTRVYSEREVSVERARKILGFKDRRAIYRLCELGEEFGGLEARKMSPSKRGNSKWLVEWDSVMSYKERMKALSRKEH